MQKWVRRLEDRQTDGPAYAFMTSNSMPESGTYTTPSPELKPGGGGQDQRSAYLAVLTTNALFGEEVQGNVFSFAPPFSSKCRRRLALKKGVNGAHRSRAFLKDVARQQDCSKVSRVLGSIRNSNRRCVLPACIRGKQLRSRQNLSCTSYPHSRDRQA